MRISEMKASRLKEEADQLRRGVQEELPARAAELEARNNEMKEEVVRIEQELRDAEVAEQARRAKLALLRGQQDDIRVRQEALERTRNALERQRWSAGA